MLVCDAKKPQYVAMMTIQNKSVLADDDQLKVGDRVSLANVSIGRHHFEGPLPLTFSKTSLLKVTQKEFATEEMLQRCQSVELSQASRSLMRPSCDPAGIVREFDVDCYLLKTMTAKSKRNQNLQDVLNFIVFTPEQNLACV